MAVLLLFFGLGAILFGAAAVSNMRNGSVRAAGWLAIFYGLCFIELGVILGGYL